MSRKKKLIWFESEPVITGADQARVRGAVDVPAHRTVARLPYYGPVTLDRDAGHDGTIAGLPGGC